MESVLELEGEGEMIEVEAMLLTSPELHKNVITKTYEQKTQT